MAYLFVDGSKNSIKVLRSKAYNSVKNRVTVVEGGTVSDNTTPATYNILCYPTLVEKGIKYVGVKSILDCLDKMAKDPHNKPLF